MGGGETGGESVTGLFGEWGLLFGSRFAWRCGCEWSSMDVWRPLERASKSVAGVERREVDYRGMHCRDQLV